MVLRHEPTAAFKTEGKNACVWPYTDFINRITLKIHFWPTDSYKPGDDCRYFHSFVLYGSWHLLVRGPPAAVQALQHEHSFKYTHYTRRLLVVRAFHKRCA